MERKSGSRSMQRPVVSAGSLIPRDDGTLAAGITASRLTNADDRPIAVMDESCRWHGWESRARRSPARSGRSSSWPARGTSSNEERDSRERNAGPLQAPSWTRGTVFRLEPGRVNIPPNAPLATRRMIEALHAIGSQRVDGTLCLQGGTLTLDMTNTLERARQVHPEHRHPGVDRTWLEGLPSAGVMALISLAIDPEPSSWDWAFAVADRIERADPARAGVAPLRSRLNLLLAAAGLKLEADIHPHLRGISTCLIGDTDRPGRVAGTLVVLHFDDPSIADRLVREAGAAGAPSWVRMPQDGRSTIQRRGCDVWSAWGDRAVAALNGPRPDPPGPWPRYAAAGPARGGKHRTRRHFWPSRLWRPAGMPQLPPSALRVLADDPPVVWWGWSEPGSEHRPLPVARAGERVRRFLGAVCTAPLEGRLQGGAGNLNRQMTVWFASGGGTPRRPRPPSRQAACPIGLAALRRRHRRNRFA